MSEYITQMINKRKQEAEERRIDIKAHAVACYLGSFRRLYDRKDTIVEQYNFRDQDLIIQYESGQIFGSDDSSEFSGLEIWYLNRTVFRYGSGGVQSYAPGIWESLLDDLYPKASVKQAEVIVIKKQEEEQKRIVAENEQRKKWGL